MVMKSFHIWKRTFSSRVNLVILYNFEEYTGMNMTKHKFNHGDA